MMAIGRHLGAQVGQPPPGALCRCAKMQRHGYRYSLPIYRATFFPSETRTKVAESVLFSSINEMQMSTETVGHAADPEPLLQHSKRSDGKPQPLLRTLAVGNLTTNASYYVVLPGFGFAAVSATAFRFQRILLNGTVVPFDETR